MSDSKKPEELNEDDLDAVTGGVSANGAGNLRRQGGTKGLIGLEQEGIIKPKSGERDKRSFNGGDASKQ